MGFNFGGAASGAASGASAGMALGPWGAAAGGILGGVMGGFGGKGNKTNQTSDQTTDYLNQTVTNTAAPNSMVADTWEAYQNQLQQAANTPLQYYEGPGYVSPNGNTWGGWDLAQGAVPYYTQGAQMGANVGGFNTGSQYAGQAAGQMAGAGGGMGNAAAAQQGMLGTGTQNYNFLSNAADVANNPYVQAQIQANNQQIGQQLSEDWLPQLQQGAVGGRGMGSSRQGIAQGQAIERAARASAQQTAATQNQAYLQGLGAQQFALGQQQNVLNAQTTPYETQFRGGQMTGAAGEQAALGARYQGEGAQQLGLSGNLQNQAAQTRYNIGQQQEGYAQRQLEDAMARWNFNQQEPWTRMGMLGSNLQNFNQYNTRTQNLQSVSGTQGTATAQNPNYQNQWQQAAGALATGAGVYSDWQKQKASG